MNHPIECTEIRERIPLYVGGDLDLDVLANVREHLGRCPVCAEQAEQAARGRDALIQTLRTRESDYKSPGLWSGIQAALHREGVLGESTAPVSSDRTPGPQPTFVLDRTHDEAPRGKLRVGGLLSWAPLATAAAALVLFFFLQKSSDPGGTLDRIDRAPTMADGSGTDARGTDAVPVTTVADPGNALASTPLGTSIAEPAQGGLRRVQEREMTLEERVRYLDTVLDRRGVRPLQVPHDSGVQLTNYR